MARIGVIRFAGRNYGSAAYFPAYALSDLPTAKIRLSDTDGVAGVPTCPLSEVSALGATEKVWTRVRFAARDGTRFLVQGLPMYHADWAAYSYRISPIVKVVLAGLGGTLAPSNGEHLLYTTTNTGATILMVRYFSNQVVYLTASLVLKYWEMRAARYGSNHCYKAWRLTGGPRLPDGAYAEYGCQDYECADYETCEKSAGATCVVSMGAALAWETP